MLPFVFCVELLLLLQCYSRLRNENNKDITVYSVQEIPLQKTLRLRSLGVSCYKWVMTNRLTKEEQREKIRLSTVGSVSVSVTPKKKYSSGGKRKSQRGTFLKHVKLLYG